MNTLEYKNNYEHSITRDIYNVLYYMYFFTKNKLFNRDEYNRGCEINNQIRNC